MRGWLQRRAFYERLKDLVTGKFPQSKILRRKVVGYKISLIGKKMEKHMKTREEAFHSLIGKMHSKVQESNSLLE